MVVIVHEYNEKHRKFLNTRESSDVIFPKGELYTHIHICIYFYAYLMGVAGSRGVKPGTSELSSPVTFRARYFSGFKQQRGPHLPRPTFVMERLCGRLVNFTCEPGTGVKPNSWKKKKVMITMMKYILWVPVYYAYIIFCKSYISMKAYTNIRTVLRRLLQVG